MDQKSSADYLLGLAVRLKPIPCVTESSPEELFVPFEIVFEQPLNIGDTILGNDAASVHENRFYG